MAILAILLIVDWIRMEWIRLSQDKAAIAKNEEVLDGLRDAQAARNAEMAPKLAEGVGLPAARLNCACANPCSAVGVTRPKNILCVRIALLGRLAIPLYCLGLIFCHSFAYGIISS